MSLGAPDELMVEAFFDMHRLRVHAERERLHALVRTCAGHASFSEVCARVRVGSVHC